MLIFVGSLKNIILRKEIVSDIEKHVSNHFIPRSVAVTFFGTLMLFVMFMGVPQSAFTYQDAETANTTALTYTVYLPVVRTGGTAYFVSPNGKDSNPGTKNAPWQTISKANSMLVAGDTVYLRAGNYDEKIQPRYSGEEGAPITYINYPGESVTVRGKPGESHLVVISNKSHIVIDGLNLTYAHKFANKRFEWVLVTGNDAKYNIIRNNHIYRPGDPLQSYKDGYREWGIVVSEAQNTLVEANLIQGVFQGVHIKNGAQDTIVRGNTISGTSASTIHIGTSMGAIQGTLIENNVLENSTIEDGIQFTQDFDAPNPGNDISNLGTIIRNNVIRNNAENAVDLKGAAHVVVEGNTIYGTIGSNDGPLNGWNRNSHGTIIRGSGTSTRDVIIRNNVLYDNANGVQLFQGYKVYNNTFASNNRDFTGPNSSWTNPGMPAFWSIYHFDPVITNVGVKNNLVIDQNVAEVVLRLNQDQAQIDIDYNGYGGAVADLHQPTGYTKYNNIESWKNAVSQAVSFDGDEAHSIQFSNPNFVNVPPNITGNHTQFDFHLNVNSPAIDAGGWLTQVIGNGSGKQFRVEDAGYFMAGYGITAGDTIRVGSNETAIITHIDYAQDLITVDRPIAWSSGDGVSLPYSGVSPDLGAFEFNGE